MRTYRVTLLGRDVTFPIRSDQTVLEAAESAGVTLLAGCRHGACRTCAVRFRGGRVHLPEGTALTPEMLRDHIVLPCVMTVSSDVLLEPGPPGQPLDVDLIRAWTD